jgi:putative transposase
MSKVGRMFADTKYHNFNPYEWVEANAKWELDIVCRPEGPEGWVRLPIRWTAERTFTWLGRCRRLRDCPTRGYVSNAESGPP